MEEWRDIKGYEGKYKISSYGKVKSLKHKDEKLLKPSYDKDGYKQVILCNNGIGKKWFIHRLVAIHFLPNPNNLPQVNHKDEDKANNAVENLEWCTCKYNINYGTAKNKRAKSQGRQVLCITTGEIFYSIREAGRYYSISKSHISECCKGKLKSCGKHPITGEKLVWKYL
ncbi:NUMOD4 domain-containing protein [Clostridium sp.]|uniref:NUMOD4 domain-containing protein n=1 Tax=Clostridium sp. TaxID=1506 RepID=UPI0025C4358B|nr:NUMOD4 domain-containing protein [Clostridium sp.]